VKQTIRENTASDMPRALAQLETSVDVIDPTTLELKITNWNQMRTLLTAYISQNLKEGIDYYTLTVGGKESKPSLSKAGSEKFLSLFNVQAKFRKDDETWEMLGRPAGVICYVCALYTKSGEFVGEGRGAREVRKDKDINKAIKMAQKCLGGTTPILIRGANGITRTLVNKLAGRDLTNLWIAGPHGTWRRIVRVDTQPLGPIRRLLFRDGLQVTASLDHCWPLVDGRLVETAQLAVGDCIQRSMLPSGDARADHDLTWMAGLFVAEGDMMQGRGIRFHLHAKEDHLVERLERLGERLGAPRYNGGDLGTIVGIGEGEEMTYEIEVDGDHLFCLANGLVTHNSAQIDAILRTGSLSDYFTQDLEDQPEQEEKVVRQQKTRIVALLRLLGTDAVDKAGYAEAVQHYTGLALVPELYQDIIHRLEDYVTESLPNREDRGDEIPGVS